MKIRHLRWWLCGLMFVATGLLPGSSGPLVVVVPAVTAEFHMSNQQYSYVTRGFLAATR